MKSPRRPFPLREISTRRSPLNKPLPFFSVHSFFFVNSFPGGIAWKNVVFPEAQPRRFGPVFWKRNFAGFSLPTSFFYPFLKGPGVFSEILTFP